MQAEALAVSALSKRFGATRALDAVTFGVRSGEIHALVGANGSGKSTLIKILAGVETADAGTLATDAASYDAASWTPALALHAGLRFVHQGPTALPDLTVAENLAVGHDFPVGRGGRIRWTELHRHAEAVLERFGIAAAPRTPMRSLGPAVQTTVAIARALQDVEAGAAGVLVLDEPTAALPRAEVDLLLTALDSFARGGHAIVLVTHRLDEALNCCDRVTSLRDGRVVKTTPAAELDEASLARMIVGRDVERTEPPATRTLSSATALEAIGLSGGPLTSVDLTLGAGEVVGIAGLLGSGRTELLQTLFGARALDSGEIRVDGKSVSFATPREAMAAGVAYVPEDRAGAAAFLDADITENLSVAQLQRYWSGLRMDTRAERVAAVKCIADYGVKARSHRTLVGTLSGGNQQKVVLARWLSRRPKILLLDEPTQGVDVGARSEIYRLVRAAAEDGCAVLVASSDFDELARVCERVLILAGGRTDRCLDTADLDEQRLTEEVYAAMEMER